MIYIHNINPVLVSLGGLKIHYYSLAYILGLFLLPWYTNREYFKDKQICDKFSTYIAIGVILGGRMGYILFYDLLHFLKNPLDILKIWEGGMSFHGGVIGFILAVILFARKYNFSALKIFDHSVIPTTICLGLGRVANFINGELYGRKTDGSWGVIFPTDPNLYPRHPSQLYEAFLEGLVLFLLLTWFKKRLVKSAEGLIAAIFILCYGIFRFIVECFREPDAQIGFIWHWLTMGQILSCLMILAGVISILILRKNLLFKRK